MKEVVVAMEAVDLQAKQMKEQSLELKKEGPLCIKSFRNLPLNLLRSQPSGLVTGGTISVIKRGIMVVINVAHLGK